MLQADFCFTGNGIDCHEAKAFDLTELEWIRLHDSQAVISELFSDHRNLFHRNTERSQVYHEITQGFRFPVGFDDSLEFFWAIPLTLSSLSGSFSKTSIVLSPKRATMAFAVSGPIPLMIPLLR